MKAQCYALLRIPALFGVFALSFLLLSGCAFTGRYAGQNGPGLVSSLEVEQMLYDRTLLPDYNYYFTGSENDPDAILGVAKKVNFTRGFWSSINLTSEKLNFWMTFIDGDTRRMNCTWYGSYIVDPSGRRVGFYYSKYYHTVVKFPEPGSLIVYTPDRTPSGIGFGYRGNCPDD